jgi:hypothetical protein
MAAPRVSDQLVWTARGGGDNRDAARERLGGDDPESLLLLRREDEERSAAELRCDVVDRFSHLDFVWNRPGRRPSDEQEPSLRNGGSDRGPRLQQEIDVLAGIVAATDEDQRDLRWPFGWCTSLPSIGRRSSWAGPWASLAKTSALAWQTRGVATSRRPRYSVPRCSEASEAGTAQQGRSITPTRWQPGASPGSATSRLDARSLGTGSGSSDRVPGRQLRRVRHRRGGRIRPRGLFSGAVMNRRVIAGLVWVRVACAACQAEADRARRCPWRLRRMRMLGL